MAKLRVVAVKDSAIGAYMRPFFVPSYGAAVRSFRDECNRKSDDNPLYNHPGDFELCSLAVFDEESGQFEADVSMLALGRNMSEGWESKNG